MNREIKFRAWNKREKKLELEAIISAMETEHSEYPQVTGIKVYLKRLSY